MVKNKGAALMAAVLMLAALLTGCGAGPTKTVHCDRCGKELKVAADSNMEDDTWIIYCSDCEKELGLDTIVPKN